MKARELRKLRTEGKEYVVQDGDIMDFKTFLQPKSGSWSHSISNKVLAASRCKRLVITRMVNCGTAEIVRHFSELMRFAAFELPDLGLTAINLNPAVRALQIAPSH